MGKQAGRFIDGATFKRARKRFGLSLLEAGNLLGFHWTTIQRWENGETKKVRRTHLEKLVEAATLKGLPAPKKRGT